MFSSFSGCFLISISVFIKSGRTMLFSSLYFIVSVTSFVTNLLYSFSGMMNQSALYNRGNVFRKMFLKYVVQFWSKICFPILRNSLSSFDSAFMSMPKAQLPITSVVNLAANSWHSTGSFFSASFSRHCSKFLADSHIKENISFSLPEVNTGESLVRNGRHLVASTLKRFDPSWSVWN